MRMKEEHIGLMAYEAISLVTVALSSVFSVAMGFVGGSNRGPMVGRSYTLSVTLLISLLAVLGVFIFHNLLLKGDDVTLRFIVALVFTPVASLSVIVLGIAILGALYKRYASIDQLSLPLCIITLAAIYLGIFTSIFILADMLPDNAKNAVYVFYGSILGSVLGYAMPTTITASLLLTLGACDVLILWLPQYKGRMLSALRDNKRTIRHVSISTNYIDIGLGDIVLYAMISGHAISRLTVWGSATVIVVLVVGLLVNAYVLMKREMIPGLMFTAIPSALSMLILLAIP